MDRRGASGKSMGAVPLRPDPIDQFRLAADDIDRILRGEKPCCASQKKSAAEDSYGSDSENLKLRKSSLLHPQEQT
jgi:hypothetical protein